MTKALIYRPVKTAMQSGKANAKRWLLEFEPEKARFTEPLMGWTGSADMRQELRLWFDTKEDAVRYAGCQGIPYEIREPNPPRTVIKSYAENFK